MVRLLAWCCAWCSCGGGRGGEGILTERASLPASSHDREDAKVRGAEATEYPLCPPGRRGGLEQGWRGGHTDKKPRMVLGTWHMAQGKQRSGEYRRLVPLSRMLHNGVGHSTAFVLSTPLAESARQCSPNLLATSPVLAARQANPSSEHAAARLPARAHAARLPEHATLVAVQLLRPARQRARQQETPRDAGRVTVGSGL